MLHKNRNLGIAQDYSWTAPKSWILAFSVPGPKKVRFLTPFFESARPTTLVIRSSRILFRAPYVDVTPRIILQAIDRGSELTGESVSSKWGKNFKHISKKKNSMFKMLLLYLAWIFCERYLLSWICFARATGGIVSHGPASCTQYLMAWSIFGSGVWGVVDDPSVSFHSPF